MKKITFLATALLLSMSSFAQQALFDNVPVVSPEVNANHTVTFRLKAPNAQKVQITGDFLPTKQIDTPVGKYDAPGVADLVKDDKEYGALPALIFLLSFILIISSWMV